MTEKDWLEILADMEQEEANAHRRYRRHNLSLDLMGDPGVESNESYNDELREALEKAMKKLTWKQRRLLKLLYFHGYSQKEAAKLLRCSASSVSRLKKRALAELKKKSEM